MTKQYVCIEGPGKPIYAWINGVPLEEQAANQLRNISQLPFLYKHVAVMPDVLCVKG
jgi:tRNA-splicing ligase RtcB